MISKMIVLRTYFRSVSFKTEKDPEIFVVDLVVFFVSPSYVAKSSDEVLLSNRASLTELYLVGGFKVTF